MRLLRPALRLALAASLSLGPVAPVFAEPAEHAPAHRPAAKPPAAVPAHAPSRPAPNPEAAAKTRGVVIKVGTRQDLSRIEFSGPQPLSARRAGDDVILRFGNIAPPDISRLRVDPPKFLKTAQALPVKGGLEVRLTLDAGADARIGKDDGQTYVNLGLPAAQPASGQTDAKDQPPPDRASPTPGSGVVRMTPELQGKTLLLRFPWKSPLGAAAFRRGDAIWIVFDAPAKLDLALAPRGLPQMRRMQVVNGTNYSAVRIDVPATTVATATAEGAVWTLALGPAATATADSVKIGREDASGPANLTAQVAGATGVFWVADPVVGDKVAAVTALAPAKGLPGQRTFVDATLLPSVQGLAVQPIADDLEVSTDGDIVRIGRPKGLALSPASMQARNSLAPMGLPQPASMPALVDFAGWSKTGEGGFNARYDQLLDLAAAETGKGRAGGVQARLALARFLVGSELAYEAIGVLNMIVKSEPTMSGDPEFRGLRGAARVIAGRYKEAQADFSSPALAEDPASALWRGYISARLGDYTGAREQLIAGRSAIIEFAPKWKARFASADVDSAVAVGDLGAARNALLIAQSSPLDETEAARVRLSEARLADASGQVDHALSLYDDVARSDYGAISAPALLRATELKLRQGKVSPTDAVGVLDSLRFRWRGDATELETVRSLGRIYIAQGHYREALEALRSAGQRLPDLPAAVGLQADLAAAFKTLFLQGGADGLQPVQALALFYDFKEFTPIGADGDLMVRRLARRLVDVDLLDQAAVLLKYQAENRLDGVPRAEVSTDLAMIQLMNRKPEAALAALSSSRTTLLPAALNAERRVVEARALLQLGRYDHALEILGKDATPEAQELRAEVAWKQKDWSQAGQMLEARLGDRWKQAIPLSADEETKLLRAGAAYSLAGDDGSLARLRTRYAKLTDAVRAPEAMRVALSGADAGALTAADFSRAVSDADAFAGWVQRMKQRFRDRPPPVSAAKPVVAEAVPTKPAPAKG